MDRTIIWDGECVSPDRIAVGDWGYDLHILRNQSVVFSYDGKTIYHDFGYSHHMVPVRKNGETLDLRYFPEEDIIAVWVDGSLDVVETLKRFEGSYREGDWKPFDIDTATIVFSYDGYAVRCGFSELDLVEGIDENQAVRGFHVMNPGLKPLVVDRGWKTRYFKEGERMWVARHGNIDPAEYHLFTSWE